MKFLPCLCQAFAWFLFSPLVSEGEKKRKFAEQTRGRATVGHAEMFCQKCGSIMMPKREVAGVFLICSSCGHKMAAAASDLRLTEKTKQTQTLAIIEKEPEIHPIVDEKCPKCGHMKAYFWTVQTRSADEPATRFYKCEKCSHIWRKYK